MADLPVTLEDVEFAAARIGEAVVHTPCLRSETLSRIAKADVWVKFENLQFTASFKERGALNTLLQLTPDEQKRGVIAMSAGNHAQGVAYHAGRLGIPATIVMPSFTPNTKVEHTRGHGARVVLHGDTLSEAGPRPIAWPTPGGWCSSIPTTIRASSRARARSHWRCCRMRRTSTRW
jgi:threonine dehydratase